MPIYVGAIVPDLEQVAGLGWAQLCSFLLAHISSLV